MQEEIRESSPLVADEASALRIVAMQAIESGDKDSGLWSATDRDWANRAAAEIVGERSSDVAFLDRRATLTLERVKKVQSRISRSVEELRWRGWIGWVAIILSLVLGVAVDRIGAGQRINLLAPPVLLLLTWNLTVYIALLYSGLRRLLVGRISLDGPVRTWLVKLLRRRVYAQSQGRTDSAEVIQVILENWAKVSGPLHRARLARVVHFAALAFALAVVGGLYVRGLAYEFRATWESTFLAPQTVHSFLSMVLSPGALVTGIQIPSVDQLAAIRSGAEIASENAANWMHLLAATVGVVVMLPRLVLGSIAWWLEKRRSGTLQIQRDPNITRMLAYFHGRPAAFTVVPYSYRVPPASVTGLQSVIREKFGAAASLVFEPPVGYGDDGSASRRAGDRSGNSMIVLFNLAATPERETHVEFLRNLRATVGKEGFVAMVDEAGFREKAAVGPKRLDERRDVWREAFRELGIEPLFADLSDAAAPVAGSALLDGLLRDST